MRPSDKNPVKRPITPGEAAHMAKLAERMTDAEIAAAVGRPTNIVSRALRTRRIREKPEPKVRHPEEESVTSEDQFWRMKPGKPNPMGMARQVWQSKLTDTDGCLKLNGQPIKFHDLMRKTNAALTKWGLPQMDANPDWVVEKTVD